MNDVIEQVLSEMTACVRQVSAESLMQAGELIESAPRIFVAGAGRSGLCMKAFGMRLMHTGKTVHVVGETTTPSIAEADLLIVGSGSGRTASLLAMAGQAQRRKAKILFVHYGCQLTAGRIGRPPSCYSCAIVYGVRRRSYSHVGSASGYTVRTSHVHSV